MDRGIAGATSTSPCMRLHAAGVTGATGPFHEIDDRGRVERDRGAPGVSHGARRPVGTKEMPVTLCCPHQCAGL